MTHNNDIKNNSKFRLPNFDFIHYKKNRQKSGWHSNICKEQYISQNNKRPFCF